MRWSSTYGGLLAALREVGLLGQSCWIATLSLRFSCSEVPRPHVLPSYYAARVISCGPGVLSQWETVISCAGGQVFPGPFELRIVSDASHSFCHRL